VKLGVSRVAGGDPSWLDLGAYSAIGYLIVDVDWTPDAHDVVLQVQDREQTWLDLNLADATSGTLRKVLRETTKAWVDSYGSAVWLKDGSFLWFSARNGFKHLYHYKTDGTALGQVTTGRWDFGRSTASTRAGACLLFGWRAQAHRHRHLQREARWHGMTRLSQTRGRIAPASIPPITQYVSTTGATSRRRPRPALPSRRSRHARD
jgi:dipeptidyl-peptidase-4